MAFGDSTMADKREQYRDRATEVERMARSAATEESRSAYEAIAKIWRDMAGRPAKREKE